MRDALAYPMTPCRAFLFLCVFWPACLLAAATTQLQYLSGTGSDDTVDWEFKVSGGRRAGEWTTIPVPSNWEMQGFGTHRYSSDWRDNAAPDHTGWYRHRFTVPSAWRGLKTEIVVGAAMTDATVKINGQPAGPVHRGGFYEFRHDISALLRFGEENLLEIEVKKFSADESVNRAERQADYWLFGGIFRPVWLEARPAQHIVRTAIDAKHTGAFALHVFLGGVEAAGRVTAQVETLAGEKVGEPVSAAIAAGQERIEFSATFAGIAPWSAEWPNRYRVRLRLEQRGALVHEAEEIFGFRTAELRPGDGFYVNGAKVRLKGVNRHTIWPTSGRASNRALSRQDVELIKDMNMNAVRMSHYPPDRHFLEAADELGLYVIDELAGWQQAYSTAAGRPLVGEMIRRDVNHPSIVIWANGNEGGGNFELVPDYAQWDPQRRLVIHPWLNFNGINTSHYEVYDAGAGWFFHGRDVFLPTEFLHGLYDGGHAAGLDDWWNLMLRNPLAAGGFLWAFADEGIVRQDRDGAVDVAGNLAPDGIVGPYREKEGSFDAIKEIWSPVYFEAGEQDFLPAGFPGRLRVHNRYEFTNLAQVRFGWEIVDFAGPNDATTTARVAAHGEAPAPNVAPGDLGWLAFDLPADWRRHDALRVTAVDPRGRRIYTWSWMIQPAAAVAERIVATPADGAATAVESDGFVTLSAADTEVQISLTTARLIGAKHAGRSFSFANGPRMADGDARLKTLSHAADGDDYVVTAAFEGNLREVTWRLLRGGWLRLDYAYHFPGDAKPDYLGVTFDYPAAQAVDVRWLGKGPFRVWKNRLKGVEFGVWEKTANDTMTGLAWDYPEFAGFHGNLHSAKLGTTEGPITIVAATDDLFLRWFTPATPEEKGAEPRHTRVAFPPGDISLLHGIAAVGTKFHPAAAHGPAGQANLVPRLGHTYRGTVYFKFGE